MIFSDIRSVEVKDSSVTFVPNLFTVQITEIQVPGVQGPKGLQGIQGITGTTGIQGPQGVIGTTGLTGADSVIAGPTGPTGSTGPIGPIGTTGDTGAASTVAGPTGPAGTTGTQGIQGIQGVPGPAGPADPNAVHIAGTETITGDKTFSGIITGITKTTVGLPNVDNTSDVNKPVSTAQIAADTAAKDRANHTGTQLALTISDFSTAADARITAQKAVINGLATLDASTKIPFAQIPTGATATTVAIGNDARLSDARIPSNDVSLVHLAGIETISGNKTFSGTVSGLTKTTVGLANVDNTTDVLKPLSTAAVAESAVAKARGNHTGTQLANTISNFDAQVQTSAVVTNAFSMSGTLTVTTGKSRVYNDTGRTLTITATRATVNTAPTGAAIIVDITKNGTSIFTTQTNRPTIAISGFTGVSGVPNLTWANGEYLTVDIDQIGSTVAGADLTVQVLAK